MTYTELEQYYLDKNEVEDFGHDMGLDKNEKHDFIMEHYPNLYEKLCFNLRYTVHNGEVWGAVQWFNLGQIACEQMEKVI